VRRRTTFALLVLTSQILLIALAVSWFVHQVLVAANGSVYFVEKNIPILWTEIVLTIAIIIFGAIVLVIQFKRLNERRRREDRKEPDQGK